MVNTSQSKSTSELEARNFSGVVKNKFAAQSHEKTHQIITTFPGCSRCVSGGIVLAVTVSAVNREIVWHHGAFQENHDYRRESACVEGKHDHKYLSY